MEKDPKTVPADDQNGQKTYSRVRYVAVKLLSRYERSDSYIDKLLQHEFSFGDFSAQDRALLTELVNGVIRHRGKIDWVLNGFYNGDYQKCLNIIKNAMRIGLYQVLFLNKIPIPVAINESVEIIKKIQGERIAGIVNGVLRNIARNIDNIRYPNPKEDLVYYFSVIYSHPKWMVKRWIERYGAEFAEQLLMANNRRPYLPLRVNSLRSTPEEIKGIFSEHNVAFRELPFIPESIILDAPKFDIAQTDIFKTGKVTVQDPSASLAAKLAAPAKGSRVIDLCAAPGGKAFFLAELSGDEGEVVAVDKYGSKLKFIFEGAARLGLKSITTQVEDARNVLAREPFDLVFTDVPCSGLGTLSKKPDIKWKREPEDIMKIVILQREIMETAARLVKPGGVFLYSTCTIEPDENSRNVDWFLQNFPEFELDPAENHLPAEVCKDGFMQTFPNVHGVDGAFAARMIKKA